VSALSRVFSLSTLHPRLLIVADTQFYSFLQTRADSREQHKKILDEIQAASFAQGWVVDHQNSEPVKGKPVKGKPIEEVGQRLKEEIKKGK